MKHVTKEDMEAYLRVWHHMCKTKGCKTCTRKGKKLSNAFRKKCGCKVCREAR